MKLQALGRGKFQAQLLLQPLAIERIGRHHDQIVDLKGLGGERQRLAAPKGLCRQNQEFGPITMATPELPPEPRTTGPELVGQARSQAFAPQGGGHLQTLAAKTLKQGSAGGKTFKARGVTPRAMPQPPAGTKQQQGQGQPRG